MKTKQIHQFFQKKEKGQIIVIMALVFIGLIAVVGLAIDLGYLFVSYSRLRRAVDSAALAATSQFREVYTINDLTKEAKQFLELNGIGEVGTDPNSLVIRIETCESMPGYATGFRDPELCKTPARKLVRVTVTQMVQLNFLGIIGIPDIPITVDAISEAASVDLVLLIDNSDSMTQGDKAHKVAGQDLDPSICNVGSTNDPGTGLSYAGYCHPMHEIKVAAVQLVNRLYQGYDRVSVITFDRYPRVRLPLSENFTLIRQTIADITVFEAEGACPYPGDIERSIPASFDPYLDLIDDRMPDGGTCRASVDGAYKGMDCPAYWISGDASLCGNTNIGGGLKAAGNALGGVYPARFPVAAPPVREAALWVVVLLTDGQANTGYAADGADIDPVGTSGEVICPKIYWPTVRKCADQDARPTVDDFMATPVPGAEVFAARHPQDAYTTPLIDRRYDADDYARDMADFVGDPDKGQGALVFTIGLNEKYIASRTPYEMPENYLDADGNPVYNPGGQNLPAPAEALLRYAAYRGGGEYYPAPSSADLGKIFLAIANKIATRLSR
jgi:Flp pilus assembly protein TadG